MNSPDSRSSWVLSVGGLNVRIVADATARDAVQNLKKLFAGFIVSSSPSVIESELIVSCDSIAYDHPGFNTQPINLMKFYHPLTEQLLHKVNASSRQCYGDQKEDQYLVGFQNALLAYRRHEATAACLLFHENTGRHFGVGSLHKLLFVFLCLLMAAKDRFFIHGAAMGDGKNGFVFWGPSGAGKTTVAGFSKKHTVFSDDAPMLWKKGKTFYCADSPYGQLDRRGGQPRKAIKSLPVCKNLFLHQAKELKIKDKSAMDAIAEMLPDHFHSFELMDRQLREKAFHFSYELCHEIPAYDLYFTKDGRFWDVVAQPEKCAAAG